MDGWTDFYVAEVGAAAALAGLLFVAISINIQRILNYPALPGRAFQTLLMIAAALVTASFALMPGQTLPFFGWEAMGAGIAIGATAIREAWHTLRLRKPNDPIGWVIIPFATAAFACLPTLVGAALLLNGNSNGLYWIAIGIMTTFLAALQNGWVLLVEILR